MAKKPISELSKEELLSRKKTFSTLRNVVIGIFSVYILVVVGMFAIGQWDLDLLKTSFPVLLGLFSVMQAGSKLKQIDQELAGRG